MGRHDRCIPAAVTSAQPDAYLMPRQQKKGGRSDSARRRHPLLTNSVGI